MSTRWWCTRCKRTLHNEPRSGRRPCDTITALEGGAVLVHDGCGGNLLLSERARGKRP